MSKTPFSLSSPAQSDISDAVARFDEPADSRRTARTGVWILAGGLVALTLWAALAPLDEGVPTPASVSLDTKRKTVQHQMGGIIKEVLVREGERVQEDQPLMRLEDGAVRANYEAWKAMKPQEQAEIKARYARWKALPEKAREFIRNRQSEWDAMSEAERNKVLERLGVKNAK